MDVPSGIPSDITTGKSWSIKAVVYYSCLFLISLLLGACGGTASQTPGGGGGGGGGGDSLPPQISITSPTSQANLSVNYANLTLAGSVSDDNGVATVSWTNDRGGSGNATLGADSWMAAGILLQLGANTITVVARDTAGNESSDELVVDYSSSGITPLPIGSTVTTIQIQDTSGTGGADTPVSFGQVFPPGHVPAGAFLAARTAGVGSVGVPIQLDGKAYHSDGSLRHGVITVRVPSLAAAGVEAIELVSTDSPPTGAAVTVDDLPADFDAVVSLNIGGTEYSAAARELLALDSSKTWLSGPLVTEWMVSAPVKTAAGVPHDHLTARFNIRAYSVVGSNQVDLVRTDVVIENNWTYEPQPQNFTYNATVSVGGINVYTKNNLTHYRQARWRKTFWWGAKPPVHVIHDKQYLFASGAVPNYDQGIVIPEADLADMATEWTGAKTEPMGLGLIYSNFPDTGARRDIGPLPRWAARYLLSMDARAKTSMLGTADQGGTFDVHYRDKSTGLPVSLIDHPYMSLKSNNTYDPVRKVDDAFPSCGGSCSTPYTVDSAHQPSIAYVPYLVTGDYYYLEELQFWANYNMLQANPDFRSQEQGLVKWEQVRGQAWSFRTLGQAAYITPDSHPLKSYFVDRVQFNLDYYNNKYSYNVDAPALGFITDGGAIKNESGKGQLSPWNDDAFTMVVGFLADMGFVDAVPLRNWKTMFVFGRFNNHPVFCKYHAAEYRYVVQSSYQGESGPVANTWADLMNLSFGSNCPTSYGGNPRNPESYLAITRGALSAAVASGFADAALYLEEVKQAQADAGADFNNRPHWAIVPR